MDQYERIATYIETHEAYTAVEWNGANDDELDELSAACEWAYGELSLDEQRAVHNVSELTVEAVMDRIENDYAGV